MQPQKNPSTGLLLELVGFLGFLGIGHIWAGKTLRGILLMFGYWVFVVVLPLFFVFSGSLGNLLVLICIWALAVLVIPILSGVWLRNEMRQEQATRISSGYQDQLPGQSSSLQAAGTLAYSPARPTGPLGGTRGVAGILLASGSVALPVGLVLADAVARSWWADAGSIVGRVLVVAIIWAVLIAWAMGGIRLRR